MSFLETVEKARAFLERNGRVSLRGLQREFDLGDEALEELVEELVDIQQVARREGRALVWALEAPIAPLAPTRPERDPRAYTPKHLADKILQSKSAIEGERKQVTVLFADVKGSMELQEDLDPEQWHAIMDRFFQILTEGVHRFEGTVNQYTGDGIMALFGAPIAHEDHAQRACYAALHLRDELRRHANQVRLEHGLSFAVRMGINSGEVVVGKIGDDLRMDYTAQGHTVGLAARMQELAEPGTAYLAESTAALVRGYFELEDLGEATVKGSRDPVRVFALSGVGALRTRLDVSRARGFSKFVGRDKELETLETALERALEGQGQVVGVVAEAGVGKSRLCFELLERCRAQGLTTYEAHGVAHGKSIAFLPILELFRSYLGIEERDSPKAAREKIAGRFLLADESLREALPLAFDFLGIPDPDRPAPKMDPEVRQRHLYGLVKRVLAARGQREATVTLLEDLHWLDAGSEAFLEAIAEAMPATRGLLVVNFRPEYHAPWMQKSYYQQLHLVPLGPEAIQELLRDLLGEHPTLSHLPERIRERTGGNPFFIEEVVQSLVESGTLTGQRGAYRLDKPIAEFEIPATVQTVLSARIDRLKEREKQVLQIASVIGKTFEELLLREVSELPETDLAAALSALRQAEFIYEASLYPEAEYAFKHPLTQEVALRSQLQDRRRRIHEAVAKAIEESRADRLDENAALLAHHWEEANQPLAAARWHVRAAAWAGRSERRAAHAHLLRTRELLQGVPESPESILLGLLASGQLVIHGWVLGTSEEEIEALFAEGVSLAEKIEDRRPLAQLWLGYAVYAGLSRGAKEFVQAADKGYEIAIRLDQPDLVLMARTSLATALNLVGKPYESLTLMDQAVADRPDDLLQGQELMGFSPYIYCTFYRSNALISLGRLHEAREALDRGQELARQHGDIEALFLALITSVQIMENAGDDPALALAAAQQGNELAERLGTPSYLATAQSHLGVAHNMAGNWDQAIEHYERVLQIIREKRVIRIFLPSILGGLALAHAPRGDFEKAVAYGREAVEIAHAHATPILQIHANVALARALLSSNDASDPDEIDTVVERAEAIRQETGVPFDGPALLEIRAELACLRGQDEQAIGHLREAHRLYTELGATGHAERLAREQSS